MSSRTRHAAIAAALLAFLLAGCSSRPSTDEGRDSAQDAEPGAGTAVAQAPEATGLPSLRDLNVLLIGIDTLGAQHLSCYDSTLATTPRIDALAAGGVRFAQAHTTAPWTQPAFASLMTGRMPSDVGVRRLFDRIPPDAYTVAELMADTGHRTAGVFSHVLLAGLYGFKQGFETYDNESAVDYRAVTSVHVTDRALARLDELAGGRFFLFVHYFDPHYAYMQHTTLRRNLNYHGIVRPGMRLSDLRDLRSKLGREDIAFLRALYHDEVTFTDREVGRLLDGLAERGLVDSTLVILVADHGEELMEHGWIGHVTTLREELLHVPLIVSLPGTIAPRVVRAPVSLLDVMPTLVALDGRRPGVDITGRSLAPDLVGRDPATGPRDLFAEVSFLPRVDSQTSGMSDDPIFKTALLSGEMKLIHDLETDGWRLYDLAADPAEDFDILKDDPGAADDLRPRLAAWEAPRREAWFAVDDSLPQVDEETLRRVRSLGYVR